MRNKLLLAACCLFGMVVSTHAQAGGVRVRVPFQFEFGSKVLPAGEYLVWSEHSLILLRAAGGKELVMVQANHADPEGGKTARVVFHCYERRCYLSKFWNPETEIAREAAKSKAESELARRGEMQVFALLGEPSAK